MAATRTADAAVLTILRPRRNRPAPAAGSVRCGTPRPVSRAEVAPDGAPVTRPAAGEVSSALTRGPTVMTKVALPSAGWPTAPEPARAHRKPERGDRRHNDPKPPLRSSNASRSRRCSKAELKTGAWSGPGPELVQAAKADTANSSIRRRQRRRRIGARTPAPWPDCSFFLRHRPGRGLDLPVAHLHAAEGQAS